MRRTKRKGFCTIEESAAEAVNQAEKVYRHRVETERAADKAEREKHNAKLLAEHWPG